MEPRAAGGTRTEITHMIVPPTTYAQWAALLKTFAEGTADEDVLHAMHTGTIAWQSGVAARFAQRFMDALHARVKRASDVFDRAMQRASDERAMIGALLALRRSSPPLCRMPPTVCRRAWNHRQRATVRAGWVRSYGTIK